LSPPLTPKAILTEADGFVDDMDAVLGQQAAAFRSDSR
jgi:hypothetical protein